MTSLRRGVFLWYLLVAGSNGFVPPALLSRVRYRESVHRSADRKQQQVEARRSCCCSVLVGRSFPLEQRPLVPRALRWSLSMPFSEQTRSQTVITLNKQISRFPLLSESLRNHCGRSCRKKSASSAARPAAVASSRQQEDETTVQDADAHSSSSLPLLQRLTKIAKLGSCNPESKMIFSKLRPLKVVVVGLLFILATSSTTGFCGRYYSFLRNGWRWMTHHYKRCLGAAFLAALLVAVGDMIQTRRRQAVDPTSEWSRYAQHPALRGLALSSLAVQVSVLALLGRQQRIFPAMQARAGRCLADGLLKVGPLYIKLGQIISSQANLIPKAWAPALEKLQDQVPAQSGAKAASLAYAAWPGGQASFDETFESVDWTPLAAASLGQVHRATLRKRCPALLSTTAAAAAGTTTDQARQEPEAVALKLQRPFVREIYDQDFAFLMSIAQTVDRFLEKSAGSIGGVQQSWSHIFRNAEAILYREIDYVAEAENGMRFSREFGLNKSRLSLSSSAAETSANDGGCTVMARNGKPLTSASSWLRSPHVYAELSSEKVLVMEYVPSIKVTKSAALDEAGLTVRDKEYLAECLGRSYLRQLCCNKFFSTDPHAGNLGVETLDMTSTQPDKRVRLCFYDFGQVAELRQNQADGILEILEAIIDSDVDRSVRAFQKMGVLKDGADLDVVRAKVADNYRTGKIKAKNKKGQKLPASQNDNLPSKNTNEPGKSNNSSSDAQVMQYFTLPAEYAFVGRALAQMDGVGKSLDPDFDFISAAAPWFYEIKGADKYLKDEAAKKLDGLKMKLFGAFNFYPATMVNR